MTAEEQLIDRVHNAAGVILDLSENRTWIEDDFWKAISCTVKRQKAEEFLRGKTLDQGIAQKAGEIAKPLKDNVYK